jgi:outer membrane protein assembly factor BamB
LALSGLSAGAAVGLLDPVFGPTLGGEEKRAAAVEGESWAQIKLDARRSGDAPDRSVGASLGLLAAVPMTDAILTSPVIAAGKIYAVDAAGVAVCIDATTFKVIWRFESRGGAANCNNVSSPALVGKYLHFGTTAGSWYVLNAADGSVVREHRVGEPVFASAVVANDRVYFATLGARVYALKPDGAVAWTWDYLKEEIKFEGDRWSGASWLKYRKASLRPGDQFICARDLAASRGGIMVPIGGSLVWLMDKGDHAEARDIHGRNTPTYGLTIVTAGTMVYWQRCDLDNIGQVEQVELSGPSFYSEGPVAGTETSYFGPGLASLASFSSVSLRGTDVFRTRPQEGYGLCRHRAGQKEPDRLLPAAALAPPVILKDSVIYGDLHGALHVVPLAEGRAAWSFRTAFGKAISAPAAVVNGRIYFGCEDGYLYVLGTDGRAPSPTKELDLCKIRSPRAVAGAERYTSFGDFGNTNAGDDGMKPPFRLKWVRRFEGTVKHASTFGGGRMYTHTAEGQIFAVEEETGRLLWRAFHPGVHLSYTSPLYHRERLLVPQAGPETCWLRCLDAASGKLLWEAPFEGTPGWTRQAPPVVQGNIAYYAFATGKRTVGAGGNWLPGHQARSYPASQRPIVRAYDLETGKTVWERDFSEVGSGGDEGGLCLLGGILYYSCFFGTGPMLKGQLGPQGITAALEPATGKTIWSTTDYTLRGGCTLAAKDGRLYLTGQSAVTGTTDRHVWCLNAKDGALVWKSDPLLGVLQVTTVGPRFLFVHAQYRQGYVLDKDTGKIITIMSHPYKCTRFTLSEPYILGPNLDLLDLTDPKSPKLVATGPRLDPSECVASVVSNGRLFYTALSSGLQVSEVFGREADAFVPAWADR